MSGHDYYTNNPGAEYVPAQYPRNYNPQGPSAPSNGNPYETPPYQPQQYAPPAQNQYLPPDAYQQHSGYTAGPDRYQQSPAPDTGYYPYRDVYQQQQQQPAPRSSAASVSPIPGYTNQVAPFASEAPGFQPQQFSGYAAPPPQGYNFPQQQYAPNQNYYQPPQFEEEPPQASKSREREQKSTRDRDGGKDRDRDRDRDRKRDKSRQSRQDSINPLSQLSDKEKGLGVSLLGGAGGALLGHEMGGGALATIGGLIAGAIGAGVLEKKHQRDREKKSSSYFSRDAREDDRGKDDGGSKYASRPSGSRRSSSRQKSRDDGQRYRGSRSRGQSRSRDDSRSSGDDSD